MILAIDVNDAGLLIKYLPQDGTWLKVKIRLAPIVIASPVWGFRSRRSALCLTTKLQKPDARDSSDSRVDFMMEKTDSIISADSFFDSLVSI